MRDPDSVAGRVFAEAVEVLNTCDASTDKDLLAWAVGVVEFGHPIYLPARAGQRGPEMSGRSLERGRSFYAHRNRWEVIGSQPNADGEYVRHVYVKGTWNRTLALITSDRVGDDLRTQLRAVLDVRMAATADGMVPFNQGRDEEAEVCRDRWWAIEDRCYDVAGRVWDRCRPATLGCDAVFAALIAELDEPTWPAELETEFAELLSELANA